MRRKLQPCDKRSRFIGIKVQPWLYYKLVEFAQQDDCPLSTFINCVLSTYVDEREEMERQRMESDDRCLSCVWHDNDADLCFAPDEVMEYEDCYEEVNHG